MTVCNPAPLPVNPVVWMTVLTVELPRVIVDVLTDTLAPTVITEELTVVLTVELPREMADVLMARLLPKLILLTVTEVFESNALPGNLPAI